MRWHEHSACLLTHVPDAYRQYKKAMRGVRDLLLMRTSPGADGLLYIAERRRRKGAVEPKMDHLVCFLPGLHIVYHAQTHAEHLGDPVLAFMPRFMCCYSPVCVNQAVVGKHCTRLKHAAYCISLIQKTVLDAIVSMSMITTSTCKAK